MTAAEAKKAGKVWAHIKLSGGKETPLLGDCRVESKGPLDPDVSFVIWMLVKGLSVKEAQAELKKAKKARKDGRRS